MMEQEKGSVTNFLVMISKILKEIPNWSAKFLNKKAQSSIQCFKNWKTPCRNWASLKC
jgi:hypothetical protein